MQHIMYAAPSTDWYWGQNFLLVDLLDFFQI